MSSQSVQRIVALANQLRQERPNQYGVKGAKPGYVKDGWTNAVKTATLLYYTETGKTPKKPRVTSQVPLPKQTKTNNPLPKQTILEPQTNSQTNIIRPLYTNTKSITLGHL